MTALEAFARACKMPPNSPIWRVIKQVERIEADQKKKQEPKP